MTNTCLVKKTHVHNKYEDIVDFINDYIYVCLQHGTVCFVNALSLT
jgi:hypothetical protein